MNKILQTLRYLVKSFSVGIAVGFLVILSSVAVSDLVYYFTDMRNPPHPAAPMMAPFEVTAGIFALLIGLVLFIVDFRVALANGISRKTFWLANLPGAALVAAAFSIFNLIVIKVHSLFWPMTSMSEQFYPHISWIESIIYQFALYLFLIAIGWFVAMAYYRSSTPVRWAISVAPFVLLGLLIMVNSRFGGGVFEMIGGYILWSSFFTRVIPIMLAYAAVLYGLVFLLIRRAPLKD